MRAGRRANLRGPWISCPQHDRLLGAQAVLMSVFPGCKFATRQLWVEGPSSVKAGILAMVGYPSIEESIPSAPSQNFKPAEIGPHALPVLSNHWEVCCKYRGFWRMLRCLTLDPVVAQPTVDRRPPVQLRSLCLFNPAVGTRQRFTIPFHGDPPLREVALQPPGKSQQAPPMAMLSWRTKIPAPYRVAMRRLGRQPGG